MHNYDLHVYVAAGKKYICHIHILLVSPREKMGCKTVNKSAC